ncbi:MAG: hypothetical protein ACF8PG_13795 [Maioricimonas sp. JB045]|uniref:hypothetical protein n=1 Tax=Maioricimonas sp. JC845 TaxID=3232138 RepID=UPI0034596D4D
MNAVAKCAVLAVAMMAVGCSSSVQDNPVPVTQTGGNAKIALQDIAKSGQLGSDVMTIEEEFAKLKEEGAANADELLSDLEEMKAMSSPAEIKKKAEEIAGKL